MKTYSYVLPVVGAEVTTPKGKGTVTRVNRYVGVATVTLTPSGKKIRLLAERITSVLAEADRVLGIVDREIAS